MTLGAAIANQLLATSAVTALLGQRIYHMRAPEGEPAPYAVFTRIDDPQEHSCGDDDGLGSPFYQISVYADDSAEADTAATAIVAALRDYKGTLGGSGGFVVERIHYEGRQDIADDPAGLIGAILEFEIMHQAQS